TLISRADGVGGVKANFGSSGSSVSADGRYVAFSSTATNLDPDDTDPSIEDVYVRDTVDNETTLVSRAGGEDAGGAANGAKGDGNSVEPAISADGRFVAFQSDASNLDPDDTEGFTDVFVRDTQENTTTLASRASTATGANSANNSFAASISADGLRVAFSSFAANLHPDDADAFVDLFVRDLSTNETILASRSAAGANRNGDVFVGDISADGSHVAFEQRPGSFGDPDDTLHPDDVNFDEDVFARDLENGETTLISRADGAGGAVGDGESTEPAISADGSFVAFASSSANFDPLADDGNADIFVRDTVENTTTLASRADGANGDESNDGSTAGEVSADGRYVSFTSRSTNLHTADIDDFADIFVRDLEEDTTILASRASGESGAKGNEDSNEPSLSADGRHVSFSSSATNLHPDDDNNGGDVFLRDALGPPPDTTPPDTTITAGPNGPTNENHPTFTFESDESGSTFECRTDSADEADFQPCRAPFRTGRLAEGEHTFEVRAIDPSGNTDETPASRTFTVDTGGGSGPPPPNPRGCTISGTPGNDANLRGTPAHDVICGLGGNDVIRGLGRSDLIYGDAGNDTIYGGPGGDRIIGGAGDDRLFGGGGGDVLNTRDDVRGNDLAHGGPGRDTCAADPEDRKVSCP
ncbi:MAG: hypothetical protein ACRDSJ_25175, partial [Rubrobacteraceae bacterium]